MPKIALKILLNIESLYFVKLWWVKFDRFSEITPFFTPHDQTPKVNIQSSGWVFDLIISTFPTYVETRIMNSLTRYFGH